MCKMKHKYRITCADGDQYEIQSDSMNVTDGWVKFCEYNAAYSVISVIAAIKATDINNIQLVNNETGEADRIKRV